MCLSLIMDSQPQKDYSSIFPAEKAHKKNLPFFNLISNISFHRDRNFESGSNFKHKSWQNARRVRILHKEGRYEKAQGGKISLFLFSSYTCPRCPPAIFHPSCVVVLCRSIIVCVFIVAWNAFTNAAATMEPKAHTQKKRNRKLLLFRREGFVQGSQRNPGAHTCPWP